MTGLDAHEYASRHMYSLYFVLEESMNFLCIGGDGHKFEPGSYCNVVIEELLLPVIEAVLGLTAESAQLSLLTLTVSIFLSELRRVITTNKRTYR